MKTKLPLVFLLVCMVNSKAPAQNTWTQMANLSGINRAACIAFSMDSAGYVGLGYNFSQSPVQQADLWKYSPATDSWTQVASKPGSGLSGASAFAIGSKGYIVGGMNSSSTAMNELWEYDAVLNSWVQKASCPCAGRDYAVAFSINGKGYFGTGYDGSVNSYDDFWEYNPSLNFWFQRASVPGTPRSSAVGFTIGNKGYIGSGYTAAAVNDFYQYNPQTNSWTQKASIGAQGTSDATGFAIGDKGYICTGYVNSNPTGQLLEYDTLSNTWTPVATLTGSARSNAVGFAVNNKGYISCGNDISFTHLNDLWEYTPNTLVTGMNGKREDIATLLVYPSVASDKISIKCRIAPGEFRLSVINSQGRLCIEKVLSNLKDVDISLLPSGMYFVRIKSAAGNFAGRFVRE